MEEWAEGAITGRLRSVSDPDPGTKQYRTSGADFSASSLGPERREYLTTYGLKGGNATPIGCVAGRRSPREPPRDPGTSRAAACRGGMQPLPCSSRNSLCALRLRGKRGTPPACRLPRGQIRSKISFFPALRVSGHTVLLQIVGNGRFRRKRRGSVEIALQRREDTVPVAKDAEIHLPFERQSLFFMFDENEEAARVFGEARR